MIGVRLDGRLGNQLFQYAFAFSLAKKFKTIYIIDNDHRVDQVKKYFKTNQFLNNRFSRRLYKKWIADNSPLIQQVGDEPTDAILLLIDNNQFYQGFFQSELYFQNISGPIQKYFRLKPIYKKIFLKKYRNLFAKKKVLAIHYRLSDYLIWGSELHGGYDLTLPESYYRNALQQVENLDDYTIVVVTDDTKNIEGKLQDIGNKLIISDHAIIDFQVLMHADMIIASNSSFCWWAAYLNPKHPTVFAPRYWHGFKVNKEMPSNIIPRKFIAVDVY